MLKFQKLISISWYILTSITWLCRVGVPAVCLGHEVPPEVLEALYDERPLVLPQLVLNVRTARRVAETCLPSASALNALLNEYDGLPSHLFPPNYITFIILGLTGTNN